MLPLLLLLAACAAPLAGFPSGAPTEACLRGMTPNHSGIRSQQLRTMPFIVTRTTSRDSVKVTIQAPGTDYFKGFMVQARVPDGSNKAAVDLGQWERVQNVSPLDECAALTHADRSEKASVTVTWRGNPDVRIYATVLQAYDVFWSEMEVPEASAAPPARPIGRPPVPQQAVVTGRPFPQQQFGPVVDQTRFNPQQFFRQ